MDLQVNDVTDLSEIQRLNAMLPVELRSQVKIMASQIDSSILIKTTRFNQHEFCIQLALQQWQNLDQHQRNMLFWHEVALIQEQLLHIHPSSPAKFVLAIGGVVFLLELMSQNLLGLSTTLSVMTLATYQLYQRSYGEAFIRHATTTDQAAIRLATEFGYSTAFAMQSLADVLKVLARQTRQRLGPNTYQVRLRVLEILQSQVVCPTVVCPTVVCPTTTEPFNPNLASLYSVQT